MIRIVTPERYQKIINVLKKRQPDVTVLAESVYKPHNLSAILRSCDAVGIGTVYAVNPTGGIPTFNDTSASAEKWVELKVLENLDDMLNYAKAQKMQVLAAHLSEKDVDYRQIDYCQPTCIVMGNEKWGVSEEASQKVSEHIIIPMLGMVESLNVSVATAVILFELQRQRLAAGFYDKVQLSAKAFNDQCFRWGYPREARRFDELGLAYPQLDDKGNYTD